MIDATSFAMVDTLRHQDIERHPVWGRYAEPDGRSRVLGWGVSEAALDAEIARFEYCGTQPLYPILEFDPLPRIGHLIVAARFVAASETNLTGYLLEPHAFGFFVGEREFCFNRQLVGAAAITARKLSEVLAEPADGLFPVRYETGLRSHDGRTVEGEIRRYW
jgi:hypothetical protein